MKTKLILLALLLAIPLACLSETKVKTSGIADAAVTNAKLGGNAVTTDKVALDTLTAADLAPDSVGTSEVADGTVAAGDLAATLDLSSKTLTLPVANTPAFTKAYTSPNQTITSAGALTLAHGLGGMPALVQIRLKCTTAELGYSIGDEVIMNPAFNANGGANGVSIVPDATNLNIRFSSTATAFAVNRKDTGAAASMTNANWVVIFKAWL